jgi:hypothetical protein
MQAGATWLGSNMTLTSSALLAFGSRRAMTASSLPLRADGVRLHPLERCAQKPGPRAGSTLFTRDACRELYDIFCNIVGSIRSPLRANIYVHVLDMYWVTRYTSLGELFRYADDIVRHEARAVPGANAPTAGRRAVSLPPSPGGRAASRGGLAGGDHGLDRGRRTPRIGLSTEDD